MDVDILIDNESPVVDIEVANRAGGIDQVLRDDTMVGDGVTEPLGVNPDIIPTAVSQLENDSGFLTKVPAQYVTETELDNKGYITDISGLATKDELQTVESVIPATANAQNQLADQGFVNSSIQTSTAHFRGNWDTWADVPSDPELYPVDAHGNHAPTPNDYLVVIADEQGGTWRYKYTGLWSEQGKDGWQAEYQVNETPLTAAQLAALNSGITADAVASFVKNTDYAVGGKAGVIKVSAAYGFGLAASNGYLTGINRSLEQYNSAQTTTVISKGALENIKNDYVKRGITENDITLTDDEKTSARTWIGAVGNTDYAGTDGSPGIIRTSVSYGTQMVASGYIRAGVDTLETYKTRGVNAFIGKGTLENIKDDYVKRGITANTIALTDEEKAAAQAWLGVESSGGGDYLPLSGGTVNGAIEINSDKGAGAKIESPGYKQLSIISTSSSTIGFVFDVATKALCPIKSYVSSASGALGKSDSKWETIYATKLNNGADIAIPTVGGTMALQSNAVVLTADTVELATNTIYNADELAALTITLPTMDSTYISQLNFTSGATATAFTAPDTIKWAGDDITDNAFVPAANKRYSVMFYSDNVNIRAIVQGVE